MSADEKKRLYDAIGYVEDSTPSAFPEEVSPSLLSSYYSNIFSMLTLIYLFDWLCSKSMCGRISMKMIPSFKSLLALLHPMLV